MELFSLQRETKYEEIAQKIQIVNMEIATNFEAE